MITEDYVSFEIAKLLKEKGFKNWCYKCYGTAVCHKGVPISFDEECELKDEGCEDEIEYVEGGCLYDIGCDNRKEDEKLYAAPTLQMAMKWVRVKGYQIIVKHTDDNGYFANILTMDNAIPVNKLFDGYNTYEQACESAIKYCLENLI